MKKTKILALFLALVMILGTAAVNAVGEEENPTLNTVATGAVVAFDSSYTKLDVSYFNTAVQSGSNYVVWVIQGKEVTEGGGTKTYYTPTDGTILYIGQATASGTTVSFPVSGESPVYPKTVENSAVMLSGPGLKAIDTADGTQDGLLTLATINVPAPAYMVGDATGDGEIDTRDLTRLAKYLVGGAALADDAAGDVTGDGEIDTRDLTRLAKYLVGGATLG